MKNKNLAGFLSLLFGVFGVHRFYLEQRGRGIMHLVLAMLTITSGEPQMIALSGLIAFIDCIVFWSMDRQRFDEKYNRKELAQRYAAGGTEPRSKRDKYREHRESRMERRRERYGNRRERRRGAVRAGSVTNPYKQSGIQKFKDFDYRGAVADFEKALEVDSTDLAVHFNLACAYSLTENAERAFHHLDRAVKLGFKDTDRIKTHDALAFLRIQPEFPAFERAGFQLPKDAQTPQLSAPAPDLLSSTPDLLDQLQKLGDLRDRGLLTEEEFAAQKAKLLR